MIFRLFCFLIAGLFSSHLWAGAVQIESGKMTLLHKTNQAEFPEKVHLTRDDFELFCDRLLAYYNKTELERLEAFGNVRLHRGKMRGTAKKAVLNQRTNILTLSGKAVLEQEGSRVEGEEIVHNMKREKTVVLPNKGGRIHMTIESDSTGNDLLPASVGNEQ
ncbi:MAG: lipopolysaccharide transport periplasmic protein LptA [Mariprofundus sp.]